jgi:hypothetical protein
MLRPGFIFEYIEGAGAKTIVANNALLPVGQFGNLKIESIP